VSDGPESEAKAKPERDEEKEHTMLIQRTKIIAEVKK
jgi:hypothetical protein